MSVMKLLGKVDGILISLIGGAAWVLQDNGHDDAAIFLAGVATVLGLLGAVGGCAVWRAGGHQAPAVAAGFGHFSPWLLRAAALIGLAWVSAWAAAEAGVEVAGTAAAIGVVAFGVVGDVVKPVKEKLDEFRPAAFGEAAIKARYGKLFTGGGDVVEANAYQAVYYDRAEMHDVQGNRVADIDGWKLAARQERLETIALAIP